MKIDMSYVKRSSATVNSFDALYRSQLQVRPLRKIHLAGHGFRATTDRQEFSRRKISERLVALLRAKVQWTTSEQVVSYVSPPSRQATESVWFVALGQLFDAASKIASQQESTEDADDDPD